MGQGKYAKEDGGGSVFVLLVILVLIVGIVAAAGMIMAVLNYNRENTTPVQVNVGGSGSGSGSGGYEEKYEGSPSGNSYGSSYGSSTPKGVTSIDHYDESVWNFEAADYLTNLIYIDRKTAQFRGHFLDILHEVCQIAGKNCEISHTDWRDCWFNDKPQIALQGRWVDACIGFTITVNRIRSLKFSHQLIKPIRPALLTGAGSNVNPDNLNGIRIGILNGYFANAYCIFASTGYDISDNDVVTYDDVADLEAGVNNGDVDAAFISETVETVGLNVVRIFEPCLLGGDSLVMRKDSRLKNWWDPAFEKLVNSQAYRQICNDLDDPAVHGQIPGLSAADTCVNL